MQVAMATPQLLGEVPTIPVTTEASAIKIVQSCAVSPVEEPATTAIVIFRLVADPADQNALALMAINLGANARCVQTSLALARQAQAQGTAQAPAPLPPAKEPPGTPPRGMSTGAKVGVTLALVAAVGGIAFGLSRYAGRGRR